MTSPRRYPSPEQPEFLRSPSDAADKENDVFFDCLSPNTEPCSAEEKFEDCLFLRSDLDSDSVDDADSYEELQLEIAALKDTLCLMESLAEKKLEAHQLHLFFQDTKILLQDLPEELYKRLVKNADWSAFRTLTRWANDFHTKMLNFVIPFELAQGYCKRHNLVIDRKKLIDRQEQESGIIARDICKSFEEQIYHSIDFNVLRACIEFLKYRKGKLEKQLEQVDFRLIYREHKERQISERKPFAELTGAALFSPQPLKRSVSEPQKEREHPGSATNQYQSLLAESSRAIFLYR